MKFADETHDHRWYCQPQLLTLRMLTRSEDPGPVPHQVVAQVAQATSAIIAEVKAAYQADLGRGNERAAMFLQVRLDRLTAAAEAAIATARRGTQTELYRQLSRFEALTSAIWVVQDGLPAQSILKPHWVAARREPHGPLPQAGTPQRAEVFPAA